MIQKELNVLDEDATIGDCVESMNRNNVSYCVVVGKSSKNFLGIITENDIFQLAGTGKYSNSIKLKDIFKELRDKASYEDSIASVVKKMYKNGFRQITIYHPDDDSKIVGVVSARDFVSHLIEYFPETVYNVIPGQRLSTESQEGA